MATAGLKQLHIPYSGKIWRGGGGGGGGLIWFGGSQEIHQIKTPPIFLVTYTIYIPYAACIARLAPLYVALI